MWNMDSERIPRHLNGMTARAVCPVFSGNCARTSKIDVFLAGKILCTLVEGQGVSIIKPIIPAK